MLIQPCSVQKHLEFLLESINLQCASNSLEIPSKILILNEKKSKWDEKFILKSSKPTKFLNKITRNKNLPLNELQKNIKSRNRTLKALLITINPWITDRTGLFSNQIYQSITYVTLHISLPVHKKKQKFQSQTTSFVKTSN